MGVECWPPASLKNPDDEQTVVLKQSWYLIAGIIALGAGDQIFPALKLILDQAIATHVDKRTSI